MRALVTKTMPLAVCCCLFSLALVFVGNFRFVGFSLFHSVAVRVYPVPVSLCCNSHFCSRVRMFTSSHRTAATAVGNALCSAFAWHRETRTGRFGIANCGGALVCCVSQLRNVNYLQIIAIGINRFIIRLVHLNDMLNIKRKLMCTADQKIHEILNETGINSCCCWRRN